MSVTLITRADDFGSSRSANLAILNAAGKGDYVKNVSCMAPAPMMADGAEMLAACRRLCIGMHLTLSAEWRLIKWPPILPVQQVPALVTADGAFPEDPAVFAQTVPPLEQVLAEMDAQLDYLTRLGLDIRYVDSHMLPEKFIPGLMEEMPRWAERKGLICHLGYYRFPETRMEPGPCQTAQEGLQALAAWLDDLVDGQYFSVMHPAVGGREMMLCCNDAVPMGLVSTARNTEYEMLLSRKPEEMCRERGIRCLRYDEAAPVEHPQLF